MNETWPVITIDGPGGTGKGTLGQLLAKELSWNFLDSGALYRVLALAAERHSVELDQEDALVVLAAHLDVQFNVTHQGDTPRIILEGDDVTDSIRGEKMGSKASKVGVLPKVRTALLERQRAFRQQPGLVTDGRDMGTIVFPDAILKIFLDASPEIRAERRYKQLKGKGIDVNLAQILAEIVERDKRDRSRSVAPLKPAKDAVNIDTSTLSVQDVFERVKQEVRIHFPECV